MGEQHLLDLMRFQDSNYRVQHIPGIFFDEVSAGKGGMTNCRAVCWSLHVVLRSIALLISSRVKEGKANAVDAMTATEMTVEKRMTYMSKDVKVGTEEGRLGCNLRIIRL